MDLLIAFVSSSVDVIWIFGTVALFNETIRTSISQEVQENTFPQNINVELH